MASIKRQPNGMWRARYRDASGKEHATHKAKRVDAQRWLDEMTAAVVTGTYVNPRAGRVSFEEFYEQWSVNQRGRWEDGTERLFDITVRSTTFRGVAVGDLNRDHMETWVAKMMADKMAASTIRTRVNNVRTILKAARIARVMAQNPTEGLRLPALPDRKTTMRIPTPLEVSMLLAATKGQQFHAFIALCAYAGPRHGEAAGMKVEDIDFKRKEIRIARQVQREGADMNSVRPPKYGSVRDVKLPDRLADLLIGHIAEFGTHPDGWLFTRRRKDGPPNQNTIGYWWTRAAKAAGVAGVRLHDLRHFYGSGLADAGVGVAAVQKAMGHKNVATTLRFYIHEFDRADDRVRSAVEGLMAVVDEFSADCVRTEA